MDDMLRQKLGCPREEAGRAVEHDLCVRRRWQILLRAEEHKAGRRHLLWEHGYAKACLHRRLESSQTWTRIDDAPGSLHRIKARKSALAVDVRYWREDE